MTQTTSSTPTAAPGTGANPSQPALTFDGVGMRFPDGTQALTDVSLCLHQGEFVSVVGPSGCGKSTLLKIASGLLAQSRGDCAVGPGNVAYVFQDATLLPWRTVRANVELLGELEGVDKAKRKRLAQEAIDLVGLDGSEDKYPRALSGGMKMRTSLARALTLEPHLFLFDEPFGALDEITRERLNDELLQLFAARQFAGLFITHSIAEAVFLSTRVLVMSGRPGRIVGDFAIDFGYPRSPQLRFEPAFAELCSHVSEALRGAHA